MKRPALIAPEPSVAGAHARLGGIDALRIVGAILVLLQHVTGAVVTAPGTPPVAVVFFNGLTWIAVPIFVAASGYLYGRKIGLGNLRVGSWIVGRCRRILIPYVAWTVVYLGMRAAFRGGLAGLDWVQVVFGGGAFYTLWFLPMLLWVSIVTAVLARTRRSLAVLSAVSLFVMIASNLSQTLGLPSAPQIVSVPAGLAAWVFVFSAAALLGTLDEVRGVALAYIGAALGIVCSGAFAVAASTGPRLSALRTLAILAAQLAAPCAVRVSLSWSVRASVRLRTVASVSLGFYLVQGGVLNMFQHVLPTSALPPAAWIAITTLVVGGVSALICAVLYMVKPLRPLVA